MRQNFHQNSSNSNFDENLWRISDNYFYDQNGKKGKNRVWLSLMKFVLEQTFHKNSSAHQTIFFLFNGPMENK